MKCFSVFLLPTANCLLPTVFCLLSTASNAQIAFERTYGGGLNEEGYSVKVTNDGGYILAGSTTSFGMGGKDIYLVKTDLYGDTLWTETYGDTADEEGYCVQQTREGGYIIAGSTLSYGFGKKDVYLIKTNSAGNTSWTMTYGGTEDEEGFSVEQTSDGGYIVVGRALSFGLGNWDVYLVRTNSSGDSIWTRTYGSTAEDQGFSVRETSDGGFLITGYTSVFGDRDLYLVKTNSSGDTLWTKIYRGPNWDVGNSLIETSDGGYAIAGYTNSFGLGLYDIYLIKTDSSGDSLWTKTYGGISSEYGYSIQETVDNGFILLGRTTSFGSGGVDAYMVKTDSSGDTLWTRTFGGTGQDYGRSIEKTLDGGYILAGYTDSFGAGGNDFYLIKVDESGLGVEEGSDFRFPISDLRLRLHQNYPNPFRFNTTIRYQIPLVPPLLKGEIKGDFTKGGLRGIYVKLTIYDIGGRLIETLVDQIQEPGIYTIQWDGKDRTGQNLPSGIYFYQLKGGGTNPLSSSTKRLILFP